MSFDTARLNKLENSLRKISIGLAQRVAGRVAPLITGLARSSFASGATPYGEAWKLGADGNSVTLVRSGALRDALSFTAIGTRVRAVLGPSYAKYQVGGRRILPAGNAAMPLSWSAVIRGIVLEELAARDAV